MFKINFLKICYWNANGIHQRKSEIQLFVDQNDIDVLLLNETHLTDKYNFKIQGYDFYDAKHPAGTARGGAAVLIKQTIPHHLWTTRSTINMQSCSICIRTSKEKLVLAAFYSSPNHHPSYDDYKDFFSTQGHRFIVAGDFNAKHTFWGSNRITPRGRTLHKVITDCGYDISSCGEPTYWPADPKRLPDLIDFAVTKNINRTRITSRLSLDLSSDHAPVLLDYHIEQEVSNASHYLTSSSTNWLKYKHYISLRMVPLSLPGEREIDAAIEEFTQTLVDAARFATAPPLNGRAATKIITATHIKKAVAEKRQLRRRWQKCRSPENKAELRSAQRKLRSLLHDENEDKFAKYLEDLSPKAETNYSLWKATKNLKRPQIKIPPIRKECGEWARSDEEKAIVFANHLERVFTPNPPQGTPHILPDVNHTPPPRRMKIKHKQVCSIIKYHVKIKKAPGPDNINGRMIIELPQEATRQLTQIFNAIVRIGYFPDKWKMSTIIMIPKPGKDLYHAESYRPISLISIFSKILEKIIAKKISRDMMKLLPSHQFGFRAQHGTVEQVHRILEVIRNTYEKREYCSAIFLDVAQAFDKVWHQGLLFKIKSSLPFVYTILRSYLLDRTFKVRYREELSPERKIRAGVPQGSVLGPILYLLYTADLPTSPDKTTTTTFADDTAILCSNKDAKDASKNLQEHLQLVDNWLSKWRIKVNETKSVHVTFTLNRGTCPPIQLNGTTVPQKTEYKYLGIHLDRRLTWKKHIETKKAEFNIKSKQMYWLLGRKSKLKLEYKLLLYKSILKPIWQYGCQLWQTASASQVEVIERIQNKILRQICEAPWYIKNNNILKDLQMMSVKSVIDKTRRRYTRKIRCHPNPLARSLGQSTVSRLKKKHAVIIQ